MDTPQAEGQKTVSKFPGLNLAIANAGDTPEVTIETPLPEPKPTPAAAPAEPVVEAPVVPETPIETPVASKKIDFSAMSDEEKDEALAELTGGKIKKRADLTPEVPKTPEQLVAEKEQRKNDALAWALENKVITKSDYDKKNKDLSKTDREIALSIFTSNLQADDKDLSADECEEIFNETYHQSEDASERLQKLGQKEIANLANAFRKENSLPDFETKYEETVQTQNQYKAYKGQVKEVAAELPKELKFDMQFEIDGKPETFNYSIPVDEKTIGKIISDYSTGEEFSVRNIKSDGKIDRKGLLTEMQDVIKARMFDTVVSDLLKNNAKDVAKAVLAKVKNIPTQSITLANGKQELPATNGKPHVRSGLQSAIANQN